MMQDYFSNSITEIKCDIQELENSLIVVAKKKIILSESKIIMDNSELASSYGYQTEFGSKFEKSASGILMVR